MASIIYPIISFVFGVVVTYYFIVGKESDGIVSKKDLKKQKIMELFGSESRITNNDVEKLLGVSDATAERYLDELEREGKLKQVGKTGKYTYYERR